MLASLPRMPITCYFATWKNLRVPRVAPGLAIRKSQRGGTLREMTREARLLEGEEKNLRELGKGDSWREEGVKMERAEEEEKPEGSSWIFRGTFGARTVRNPSHFAGEEHFQCLLLSRVLDCAHPSVLFLVCTSKDASWGLYHVSVSSLVHRSKAKHQYDHHHSLPRVSVRRACIPEVSHDQQCMRLTQGLKERLFVHFQSEESIDAAGFHPYCELVGRIKKSAENLGELLMGDQIDNSPYRFRMNVNKAIYLCTINNLPAMRFAKQHGVNIRWTGFPVGYMFPQSNDDYIINHVKFRVLVHEYEGSSVEIIGTGEEGMSVISDSDKKKASGFEIVGFEVYPCSVKFNPGVMSKHSMYDNLTPVSCPTEIEKSQIIRKPERGSFTHEVEFVKNNIKWPSWDAYLKMEAHHSPNYFSYPPPSASPIYQSPSFTFTQSASSTFIPIKLITPRKPTSVQISSTVDPKCIASVFMMSHPKLERYICWLRENGYAVKQNLVLVEGMLFLKIWATFTNMTLGKSTGFLQGLSSASWHDPQERCHVGINDFNGKKLDNVVPSSYSFMTLVAKNVTARGLDINDVQLIIQCEPTRDVEAYIHQSGRTGRADNARVAVMLLIQEEAAETITQVSDSVIPAFKSAVEELLNTSGLSVVELLAKALAKASGYTEIKSRSLLITLENHVTVLLEAGKPICTLSFAYGVLRRFLPEDKVESIKSLALTADGNGAVFDVATENSWMQLDRGGQHSSIVLHGRFIMLRTSLLCGYLYPGPTSACFQFAWPHLACNLPFLHL
ncbi:hypothetical protein AAG906_036691 [Vitis piasezkii]